MKAALRILIILVLVAFVASLFAIPAFAADVAKDVYTLPATPGTVTFNHKMHSVDRKIACTTCHHASKPAKPLKAAQEACSDCHTKVATPPVTTKLQGAFHDPMAKKGTCIDCHTKENAAGKKAPTKCTECHKKAG